MSSQGQKYYQEGEAQLAKGKFDSAIKSYEKALQLGENAALHGLGVVYISKDYKKSDINKGMDYLKQGCDLKVPECFFEIGWLYYSGQIYEQNYEKAVENWEIAAADGNAKANYNLGFMYSQAVHFEKDQVKALPYLEKAAEKNYDDAKLLLGKIYLANEQVPMDIQKGLTYLNEIASTNGEACYNIGVVYELPLYGFSDIQKAIPYFEQGGKLGYIQNYIHLGYLYFTGDLVPKDNNKAIQYYSKADSDESALTSLIVIYKEIGEEKKAFKLTEKLVSNSKNSNPNIIVELGAMYYNGTGTKKDFKKAFDLFSQAAILEQPAAYYNLYLMFSNGCYVQKDDQKALEMLEKSYKYGYPNARNALAQERIARKQYKEAFDLIYKGYEEEDPVCTFQLALMYNEGLGCEKDLEKRNDFYLKAGELGNSNGYLKYGMCYYTGDGVEQDFQKAIQYFTLAADMNNAQATYNLGVMYEQGQGFEQSSQKKFEYYDKAAQLGLPDALLNAGFEYYTGRLVPQDLTKALNYFLLAADKGNKQACKNLAIMFENGEGTKKDHKKALYFHELSKE